MKFKIYLVKPKTEVKVKWQIFSSLGDSSIEIETKWDFKEVLKSFREEFDLEITASPPECVAVTEGSVFLNFLSSKEFAAKVQFRITEKKKKDFSQFVQNACKVWTGDDGILNPKVANLLKNSFVSCLLTPSYKLISSLEFNEYLVTNKDLDALRALCAIGFDPNLEKFIKRADPESVDFIVQNVDFSREFLSGKSYFHLATFCYRCLPEAFPKLKQVVLSLSRLYPGAELKAALSVGFDEFGDKSAVEHACSMQADQMLELFWSIEGAFKTSINEDACQYDVSNMIPDTMLNEEYYLGTGLPQTIELTHHGELQSLERESGVSDLERIIASSVDGDSRAAKMIGLDPIRHLIRDYVCWSKLIRAVLFCIQVVFMCIFTWDTINKKSPSFTSLEACYVHSSNKTPYYNESETCDQVRRVIASNHGEFLFCIWPLLSFVFAMLQLIGFCRLIKGAGVGVSAWTVVTYFPFYDLTLLISFILRVFAFKTEILRRHYFELVAVIMILGWIRPTFYLSYTSYLSAFSVALKSSMIKYIVCFVFMFTFVYVGFALSFKTLLSRYTSAEVDKPMHSIAYISFVTLFGMGELDQMPDSMEDKVDKLLFLKFVICMYCSCVAILILAIIRQPDEDLVARVGSELKSRINLKFLKDISWLLLLRKKFKCKRLQAEEYGSLSYELKTLFGMVPRSYRRLHDQYSLILTKDEMAGDDDDEVKDQMAENVENMQVQLASVQKVLAEIKDRLEITT